MVQCVYTEWPKNWHHYFVGLNFTRISRKFLIILSLKIPTHLKCVATLPCEMSSVLRATIENKTTSVTTHFYEINNRKQRVYCLSYSLK